MPIPLPLALQKMGYLRGAAAARQFDDDKYFVLTFKCILNVYEIFTNPCHKQQ